MCHKGTGAAAIALMVFTVARSPETAEQSKKVPVAPVLRELVKRSTLAEPGDGPFYLKGKVLDEKNPDWDYNAEFEEYWVSPAKWRRTIHSKAFSQTLVVDGDQKYEHDTGDYFPPAVETLIVSLVDPIPANVLQKFENLSMEIQQPDGNPGQCFADQYFNDEHGERVRAVVALDSQSGLLQYLWFPGWSVGVFADYRPFRHKMIAWKTKDNRVNAEVKELSELEHPDEAQFAIREATPPAQQIHTVFMDGTEFRKEAGKLPELKWPAVSGPPVTGTVKLRIVADRSGRVREARSYLASNKELKDWTAEQAMGWKFEPYQVEGVAVQVDTTLVLDFKTELKSGAANPSDASSYFHRASLLSGLRLEGAQPFHLKASFEAFGYAGLTGKGTYEEYWLSPAQWRREASLGGHTVTESRNGDLGYRKFDHAFAPLRIDEAMDTLSADLPGDASASHGPGWQVANSELGKIQLVRVSRGKVGDNGKPDVGAVAYYF